jgi:hypothetical protein
LRGEGWERVSNDETSTQVRGSEKIPQESQKNLVLRVTPARRSMSYGEAILKSGNGFFLNEIIDSFL